MIDHDVKDLALAPKGLVRIEWSDGQMPVLKGIRERFAREKPLAGLKMACCLHVTTKTANLARTLKEGGADVVVTASNPLSTQDDVAASLVADFGISVFAIKGEDNETYYRHLVAAIKSGPNITQDDGCDLVSLLHKEYADYIPAILGGTEETTTGVNRLKGMESEGALRFPVIAVNESDTKHLFDNRYGTGQSALDGLMRATNLLIGGSNFVVCGYGWCGKGVAMRARGMGASVIVTEVDPIRAIEAAMEGFRVMKLEEAMPIADVVITVTGNVNIVDRRHLELAKDGVLIGNAGHFNDEINIPALREMAVNIRPTRDFVEEFRLADGRKINLLAEGRLLNLAAGEGHPAAIMDMSFANQALAAEYLVKHCGKLMPGVHVLPRSIDVEIARLKLSAMGISIDESTEDQILYGKAWRSGT